MQLLFLPGASGRGAFWDPVRSALADLESSTLDWPGLGGTPPSADVRSYDDLARMVTDRLEGPTALIGQSMGGYVATRVAAARPDLVSHLVLCATSAGLDMCALGAVDWRAEARAEHPDAPDWAFAVQPTLEAELAALPMPTLLLWADQDPISPLAVGERINHLIEQAELVVYPSTDHWFVLDVVDDVQARIRAQLAR